MEEGDVTEEDEDDEDGIRFVTLEGNSVKLVNFKSSISHGFYVRKW